MKDRQQKLFGEVPILRFGQIDSTNEEIRRIALRGGKEGTVVVAESQTAGRGRRGRCWYSDSRENLYLSFLLRPEFAADKAAMVTLIAAVAVSRGIEEVCGLETKIKWPNDVLLSEKKVCGILTELYMGTRGIETLIVGIGINVNAEEFPDETASLAASLRQQAGRVIDKERLLSVVLEKFEEVYQSFLLKEDLSFLQKEYERRLISKGRQVKVVGVSEELSGEALGINEKGELLIRREEGVIEAVYAGEVSVRGIYGYL